MISIQLLSLALVTQPSCADSRIDGFVFGASTNRPIRAFRSKSEAKAGTLTLRKFLSDAPVRQYPMFISGTDFVTVKPRQLRSFLAGE